MKEYIEREYAIKQTCDFCAVWGLCPHHYSANCVVLKELNSAPAADVRPVVTCGECKWWTKQNDSLQGRCELSGAYPTAEWFCANGTKEKTK